MRWIFLTLLLLNALVFAVQWLDMGGRAPLEPRAHLSPNAEQLVLLREVPSTGAPMAGVTHAAPVSSQVDPDSRLCLMVGPSESEADAQKVLAALRGHNIESKIITNEVKRTPDYWVYLPPFESRNSAIRKLRELQQQYKVDSFLISQGPLANGISLGLFKSFEAASALQKERVQQGIAAKLAEVERTASEFWVVAVEPSSVELVATVTRLMEEIGVQGERRQIFCKSIASDVKVP